MMSFGQGMLIPVLPTLPNSFDITPGLAAQIFTAQMAGRLFSLYPTGILVDRYGRRLALITGPLIITLAALLSAVAPQFWLLVVAFLAKGIGTSLFQISREVMAVDLVRQDQRGRLLSVFFGVSSLGVAFGPFASAWMMEAFSFRAVFLVYAAIGFFTFLVSLTMQETASPQRSSVRTSLFDIGGLKEIAPGMRVTYMVIVFGTFTAMMRTTLRLAILPLFVVTQLGFGATSVGLLFAIIGVVEFLMIAPTGIISDKAGRKAVVVPSALIALAAFSLYPLSSTVLALALVSGIGAIGTGLALGSMSTYTYDVVPEHARGRLQTLRRSLAELGGITGPGIGGLIVDSYSPRAAFLFFIPLQLVSALLLTFVAKETLQRDRRSV